MGGDGRSRSLPGWDIGFWLYGVVQRTGLRVLDGGSRGYMILDGLRLTVGFLGQRALIDCTLG